MIHVKKVKAEYFEALRSGNKRFELRRLQPDDPVFTVGDYLALNEIKDYGCTGRCLLFRITCVIGEAASCGTLREGCFCLGLQPMPLCGEDLFALRKD